MTFVIRSCVAAAMQRQQKQCVILRAALLQAFRKLYELSAGDAERMQLLKRVKGILAGANTAMAPAVSTLAEGVDAAACLRRIANFAT